MLNYEFLTWLEGYLDLCPDSAVNTKKLRIIRNHLNLVIAVEGELGPLNQEIYDLVSVAIEKDDESFSEETRIKIEKKVRQFLLVSFPDSHEDTNPPVATAL